MVSINTNETMTCIGGETLRQKVQSLKRVSVGDGGEGGGSTTRNCPAKMFIT